MTKQQHPAPITPPQELFAKWLAEAKRLHPGESTGFIAGEVARLAYRAGADQELEACCEWLVLNGYATCWLRADRRPKPPSLKEQALQEVDALEAMGACNPDIIRRALEVLPNYD